MVQRNKFACNMKSDTMYCLLISHCPPLPCTRNLTAAGPLPRPRRWALNQSNDSYFTYQAWPMRLSKMYTVGSWERFSPLWKMTQATPLCLWTQVWYLELWQSPCDHEGTSPSMINTVNEGGRIARWEAPWCLGGLMVSVCPCSKQPCTSL